MSVELRDAEGISLVAGRKMTTAQILSADRATVVYQAFKVPSPSDTISPAPRGFSFRFTKCGLEICRDTASAFTLFIDGQQEALYKNESEADCPACSSGVSAPTITCPSDTITVTIPLPDTVRLPLPIQSADRVIVDLGDWNADTLRFRADATRTYTFLPTAFNACGITQCPLRVSVRILGWGCGDVDVSGDINIGDAVYLVNYIFAGGPTPKDACQGDANCDGRTNIADVVFLISYIFCGGPAPCVAGK
jgi:hypothetical protein